jgi:hypothetical protein
MFYLHPRTWVVFVVQQYQAKFGLVILDVLLTETKKMFLCVKTLYIEQVEHAITACETCKNVFEMYSIKLLSLSALDYSTCRPLCHT